MPILFDGAPGRVIALQDPALQGVVPLVKPNPAITFQGQKSLITRLTIAQETNHQFLHALGGDIFIYVFGDRIGQLTISGLAVSKDCDGGGDSEHGFEKMLKYYKDNKLSKRREPMTVMIGQTPVTGFLGGMTGGVFDHKLLLMQWDLTLFLLPERD